MLATATPTQSPAKSKPALGQVWHIRAVRLPDGDRVEDWWIDEDGTWREDAIAGAKDLPGKYAMAGMVDAHTHLSMDFGLFGLPEASDAVIAANLKDKIRQGVLAVRDAGALPGARIESGLTHSVRVLACGNLNAPKGRFHEGIYRPVAEHALVASALQDVARGAKWVKVIADFPGPDFNWYESIPNYSFETLKQLCAAVHAKGARVAAHVSSRFVADCVRAGIDSIEHGPMLTADVLAEMARRGTAWTPTLMTVAGVGEYLAANDTPLRELAQQSLKQTRELLPIAEQLGVTTLVGTDEQPGQYAAEAAKLHAYGLSARATLAAASDKARAYFGWPRWQVGAPADLVLFDTDPRERMNVLAEPVAVLAQGQRMA